MNQVKTHTLSSSSEKRLFIDECDFNSKLPLKARFLMPLSSPHAKIPSDAVRITEESVAYLQYL